ncbi:transporter [Dyella soli]|uniref:Transporter n=1 Tax=Dyella soli TaxID=522319 RepID=A0A4R0YNL0_9GAMM|nr:transporter [Dyella soli]
MRRAARRFRLPGACLICLLAWMAAPSPARADAEPAGGLQSRDNAWWTGPMLANSAETLPQGHVLAEPYLYDIISEHSDSFGSRTYLLYGLADRFTVGAIPAFGYTRVSGGPDSSGVQVADTTLQAQYRLTRFHEGSWVPTISIQLQETLPTGTYDHLDDRPADGMGNGAYTTSIGINSQTYFWLPNGRILRVRVNISAGFSSRVNVHGASVYGTDNNFRGNARPGNTVSVDTSLEYSVTKRWVLALDLLFNHNDNTTVTGHTTTGTDGTSPVAVRQNSGSSQAYGFAPAVEYSWTPNVGVLLGARVILGGHGTSSSITPAIALNYVN